MRPGALVDGAGQVLRTGTQPVPVATDGQWHPVELALVLDLGWSGKNGRVAKVGDF